MATVRSLIAAVACAFLATIARGQGGPPMITDDPGTPGNGRWENNISVAIDRSPNELLFDAPGIDLNYGWGDHIQLTLQTAFAILKRSEHGPVAGLGETEAAVKWRFLDEEENGANVSTFPRIIFNVLPSSARRDLAEDGTRFQLPIEVAKKIGPFDLDFEFGTLVSTVGRSEWLYGIVAEFDLSKSTSVMAELHGTSRMSFSRDVLTLNFGLRHKLTERRILIASLGHEVREREGEPLHLIGYLGVQLLY